MLLFFEVLFDQWRSAGLVFCSSFWPRTIRFCLLPVFAFSLRTIQLNEFVLSLWSLRWVPPTPAWTCDFQWYYQLSFISSHHSVNSNVFVPMLGHVTLRSVGTTLLHGMHVFIWCFPIISPLSRHTVPLYIIFAWAFRPFCLSNKLSAE